MRYGVVLFLAFSCSAGLAADDEAVKAPYVEVGDCWSFRAKNIENHGPIDEYEECITFVDRVKNVILALVTVKADGREIETSYSTEWTPRTEISGLISSPTKDRPPRFPLKVGDTFTEENDIRRALLGAVAGHTTLNFKVVGWEEVSVPAGKFRALKIEGRGTTVRSDSGQSIEVSRDLWYVPEVARFAKIRFESHLPGRPQGRGIHYEAELTGYRLNR